MKKSNLITVISSMVLGAVFVLIMVLVMLLLGILNPEPIRLVISSGSKTADYNGANLVCNDWQINEGELREGHKLKVSVTGKQKKVGEAKNYFVVSVVDKFGADVSSDYKIEYLYGTLTVEPTKIAVEASSLEKVYDGTPLVALDSDYNIVGEHLIPASHEINVDVYGSQTEIGESPSNIRSISIVDGNGDDVTFCFDITVVEGRLKVRDPSDPLGEMYDGAIDTSGAIGLGGLGGTGAGMMDVTAYRVYSETSDKVYMKIKSFGSYTGNSWNNGPKYPSLLYGTHSGQYLTSAAKAVSGVLEREIMIESLNGQYALPYYASLFGASEVQKNDVLILGDASRIYNVKYYPESAEGALGAAESAFDAEYSAFIHRNYLTLDDTTRAFMQTIVDKEGFSGNTREILAAVSDYVSNAATYNLKYNSALDAEENIAIAFLSEYKEGICQHYATSAVLLLRTLGIPARYTVGFLAETVAGKWAEVSAMKAHAWVEAYVDGYGWVVLEVTGGMSGSSGENTLRVESGSAEKSYDGTPLSNRDYSASGILKEGHTLQVDFSEDSSRTVVGSTPNIFTVTVTDSEGNDVTDEYNIEAAFGTLTVNKAIVSASSRDAEKIYDGTPLTDTTLNHSPLPDGFTLEAVISGSQTKIGSSQNTVESIVVYDSEGTNVSSNFKFNLTHGTLTVKPEPEPEDIPITIITGGDSKTYDATPLVSYGYDVIGELAEGHYPVLSFGEGITLVGEAKNIATARIIDSAGNDVTDLYAISYEYGTLKVNPARLGITSADAEKEYDGTPLTSDDFTITETDPLPENHAVQAEIIGSRTEVGISPNTLANASVIHDGNDVTDCFELTLVDGILRVTESSTEIRHITLSSGTANKPYDGTPLALDSIQLTSDKGLKEGHTLIAHTNVSLTTVGEIDNDFSYSIVDGDGVDVTSQYIVKKELGTLTVTPVAIEIVSADARKVYSGTPLTAPNIANSISLPDGHILSANITGTRTSAGSSPNTIDGVLIENADGEDVTFCFTVKKTPGTLTVDKRKVKLQPESRNKKYDGTPIVATAISQNGDYKALVEDGYTVEVLGFTGSQTSYGKSSSRISEVRILLGTEDITSNFDINYASATLHVWRSRLTFVSSSDSKTYDGRTLIGTEDQISFVSGTLASGHHYTLDSTAALTNAGSVKNTYTVTVLDENGARVTDEYLISASYGKLTVHQRAITVTAESRTATFDEIDGNILTHHKSSITSGSLVEGHTIECSYEGEVLGMGYADNIVHVDAIYDEDGNNVISNYKIVTVNGELALTP